MKEMAADEATIVSLKYHLNLKESAERQTFSSARFDHACQGFAHCIRSLYQMIDFPFFYSFTVIYCQCKVKIDQKSDLFIYEKLSFHVLYSHYSRPSTFTGSSSFVSMSHF